MNWLLKFLFNLLITVSIEEYGKVINKELITNGKDKFVTNENRQEFIKLYLEWLLNTSVPIYSYILLIFLLN